jgi:hypothetical protein
MSWTTEWPKPICCVEGCDKPVRAKGYCKNHRQRLLEYGRLEKVMTGEKTKHPLYLPWNKRKQADGAFCKEWMDFYTYVEAVGEKPEDCFLARLDESKPCGPGNWEWRKVKLRFIKGETAAQYSTRCSKEARRLNPDHYRANNYKYNFGLSIKEVEEKLKAQNFVCAMCEEPEKAVYNKTGKTKTLALDHCHTTGRIRDFLCAECNLFLGMIEKDRTRAGKAEKYLDRWHRLQESSSN